MDSVNKQPVVQADPFIQARQYFLDLASAPVPLYNHPARAFEQTGSKAPR